MEGVLVALGWSGYAQATDAINRDRGAGRGASTAAAGRQGGQSCIPINISIPIILLRVQSVCT